MYARTTGDEIGTLEFTHVAGVINIRLTDDGTGRKVKSIRLVSTDKTLSGAGTLAEGPDGGRIIVFDGGGNEAMQHVDEAGAPAASDAQSGSEITLTCPEPVTLDAETPTDFLFVVPAQTYPAGTLSFRITDDADQTVTKALSKQLVVGRAKIVDFTAIAIPKVVVAGSADDVSDAIKKAALTRGSTRSGAGRLEGRERCRGNHPEGIRRIGRADGRGAAGRCECTTDFQGELRRR